jgi:hypothetical protein
MINQTSASDYEIVFDKLRDAIVEQSGRCATVDIPKIVELSDEIEVLREIVEDLSDDVTVESATIG